MKTFFLQLINQILWRHNGCYAGTLYPDLSVRGPGTTKLYPEQYEFLLPPQDLEGLPREVEIHWLENRFTGGLRAVVDLWELEGLSAEETQKILKECGVDVHSK